MTDAPARLAVTPLFGIGLLLCAIAFPESALAAKHPLLKKPWRLLESENFSLMTNVQGEDAESLLRDLEQFRKVVLVVTSIGEVDEPIGTRAIVFAKAGQFKRIAHKNNIIGYMRPSLRGNRMVTSGRSFGIEQRAVMFHEYVHHLVRYASDRNYPTWYDEGLAETLATVYEDDGRIVVGAGLEARLEGLARNPNRIGVSRVVHEDDLSELHPYVVSYFYSLSWALVNYLHTGHLSGFPNRLGQLQQYLALLGEPVPREEAFTKAFATTPRALQSEVFDFLGRKRRPVLMFPVAPFSYQGAIAQRTMSDAETALELAFQVIHSDPEEAHALLDAALAQTPDDPRLSSAKGVAFQMQKQYAKGAQLTRAAHETLPADPVLAIDYADLLVFWNRHECDSETSPACEARFAEARRVYRHGLEQAPDNPELHSAYGWLLLEQTDEYARALTHLQRALTYQPWNSVLRLRVGLAHKHLGRRADAIEHLGKALYWTESAQTRNRAAEALAELAPEQQSPSSASTR